VNTRNIAIAFAVGIAMGLLSMWLWMRHQSIIEALQRDLEHEKQQARSAVIQAQRDSAAAASRQWEELYLKVAAEDKPKTIYLRADAKWGSNPSADSVRAYLRFRPDSILDRWYPGKGSDHPGPPQ
jgi:hypothetical protein